MLGDQAAPSELRSVAATQDPQTKRRVEYDPVCYVCIYIYVCLLYHFILYYIFFLAKIYFYTVYIILYYRYYLECDLHGPRAVAFE